MTTPQEQIDGLVAEAYASLNAAEAIADKNFIEFDFDVAYGMGGTYRPAMDKENALALLNSGVELTSSQKDAVAEVLETDEDDYDEENFGWVSSSSMC
jgi:hypothetical protein